jgi:diadenosine tetraphosphate (Ap4A) HIT family hydrolase
MFELDQRLMSDTAVVANSALCRILLMNDSRYPWLILVPRIASVSEVFELTAEQQQQLWQETSDVGRLLKNEFQADKMNIATLGNVVKQLHMHVVVRMQEDASWPAPVWGNGVAQPYTADALTQMCLRLRSVLAPMDLLDAEVDL